MHFGTAVNMHRRIDVGPRPSTTILPTIVYTGWPRK